MTDEDQAKYQARSHEEQVKPTKIPHKTGTSGKEVTSYQELRRLQKEKFDAAKNKR
jgi:hypothetical protein